jgi:CelD/BcsL family acetyltransferase involved in cellulose biosynthesis
MNVEIIRTAQGLHELEAAWNDLSQNSSFRAPFYSWTWYDTWWKHFGGSSELFVIAARAPDGRLQVVAPLMKGTRSLRGFRVSEIRFAGNSISPGNSILFRDGVDASEALATVVGCVAEHRREWDLFTLWNVPETAAYLPAFDEAIAPRGFRAILEPGWQSAFVTIGDSFDRYMTGNFGKDRRRGIRQKVRQLSERPGYQVLDFQRPEEMDRAVELAFAVSGSSWKAKLGTDMTGCPARRAFYHELSHRLARQGQVRIWISMLDETPLALQYDLVASDAMYLVVNDFNEACQGQSPGTVLLYQVVEKMFAERSIGRFQFSGDLYDYKSKWATGMHRHVTLEVFGDRCYSRFLCWAKETALPALRSVRASLRAAFKSPLAGHAT